MSKQMARVWFETGPGGRGVLVAIHLDGQPSQAEWSAWMELVTARSKSAEWDLARLANLVISDGGSPSTEQRTVASTLAAQGTTQPSLAIVTDSAAMRTLARGLGIFVAGLKAFAPSEIADALRFLGLSSAQGRDLLAACDRAVAEQIAPGASRTLATILSGSRDSVPKRATR